MHPLACTVYTVRIGALWSDIFCVQQYLCFALKYDWGDGEKQWVQQCIYCTSGGKNAWQGMECVQEDYVVAHDRVLTNGIVKCVRCGQCEWIWLTKVKSSDLQELRNSPNTYLSSIYPWQSITPLRACVGCWQTWAQTALYITLTGALAGTIKLNHLKKSTKSSQTFCSAFCRPGIG